MSAVTPFTTTSMAPTEYAREPSLSGESPSQELVSNLNEKKRELSIEENAADETLVVQYRLYKRRFTGMVALVSRSSHIYTTTDV